MIFAGIQPLSLIDFPGKLAAVLFTQGCYFRCSYCHNPSLVDPNQFTKKMALEEIFFFLEKRKKQLDAIVISGGEPTLHKELFSFCEKVKKQNYLIKLDTSGINPATLKELIDHSLIDYVAMDIKAPLDKYESIVKVKIDVAHIKKSIQILMQSNIDYEFRTTVAPFFLNQEDMIEIAKSIQGAKCYILQTFQNAKTLDPALEGQQSYPKEWMQMLKKTISTYVQTCKVR